MKKNKLSTIGRPIDPKYPSNRAIILISVFISVGGAVFQMLLHEGVLRSLLWGLGAGLAVFLAWALGRELDPDFDRSAFVAAGLALIGVFVWSLPGFLVLFWLLLLVRVVNRTTGLPAAMLDSLALLSIGGWLSFQENWIFCLATAAALFLDSRLFPPNPRQKIFAGLGVVVLISVLVIEPRFWSDMGLYLDVGAVALVLFLLFFPVMVGSKKIKSVGDKTGLPLNPTRVIAGQVLVLVVGIQLALWSGAAGFQEILPLWAAAVGAAVYRYFHLAFSGRKIHEQKS